MNSLKPVPLKLSVKLASCITHKSSGSPVPALKWADLTGVNYCGSYSYIANYRLLIYYYLKVDDHVTETLGT